jgi:outer membrane protein OmpA-like peptidoglycan-associated protein
MINRSGVLGVALACALGASSAFAAHPGFYVGAGAGESTAKDKLDAFSGPVDIGRIELDKNETAYKGFVGYNFLPWLGVEAGYTSLGQPSNSETFPLVAPPLNGPTSVELETDLSAWQGFVVGTLPLGPVDIFGKIGWANLSSDSELKIDAPFADPGTPTSFKNSNGNDDSMAVYGGGAAINFGHWAIRAEYEQYDADHLDDLYVVTGSLIYRFFEEKKPTPVAAPAPAPTPPPKPAPVVAAKCPDGDNDGVCDAADQCPTTPAGARVGPGGCDCDYTLQLQFALNSAELTAADKAEIDKIIPVLKNPKVGFIAGEIDGYTDSTGEAAYNLGLSQRRADSVAAYAKSQGVTLGDRFVTHGYGEDYPVASNDTTEGRAQNRRVVLRRTDCGPAH